MPSPSAIAAFAVLSVALIAVPGPSVMFVISRAVALGRRAALITVVGNAAGVYVQVVLVALGLGAVVERSIFLFNAIKLIGAAYLVWLGIQAFMHRADAAKALSEEGSTKPSRSVFLDGFIVGIANPKAIVFFAAILPQFVDGSASAGLQMVFLGSVFIAIALVLDSIWAVVAGSAREWFSKSPRRLERMGAAGGITMMGLGIALAVSDRKN